jgi:ubiquinone/menaquinone biosynthesis C-methylase UbiE
MGRALQQCRLEWLGSVRDANEVLIAGEGDGRFLAECGRCLPKARITVVDASAAMLDRAQRRWPDAEFIHAELPGWKPPPARFDLIVTHFFLDCFRPEDLREVVTNLADAAQREARWLLADFRVPRSGFARLRGRVLLATAYGFFRLAAGLRANRLTPPDSLLSAAGFGLAERTLYHGGVLHSDVWQRE